jgi:hypothetical protein
MENNDDSIELQSNSKRAPIIKKKLAALNQNLSFVIISLKPIELQTHKNLGSVIVSLNYL